MNDIELSDVINVPALQGLMDYHYALTGIGVGIIDLKGKVLVGTGWQDICTKFHRANPESCRHCLESDVHLSAGVPPGEFKAYRCKNNMWDIATPIMMGNKHVGNIFTGQFLYEDEQPDYELFRRQARRFGFDENAYIEALDRVPRFTRTFVNNAMNFYTKLAQMVSKSNYDYTSLKSAQDKLLQLNRTLKASKNSMHAILGAKDEPQFLKDVCGIIVQDCGHAMVWIGYANDDENRTIRPVASSGFDEGYLSGLNLTWADAERGRGPTGRAIRTGQPCTCENMLTDPSFAPWREEALRRGYAASAAFPLKNGVKTFGALTIYSRVPSPFSPDELGLLSELASRLAYGIAVLRLRAEKEETEKALREAVAARDEFLSIASHELKTPLTSLRLQLHLTERLANREMAGSRIASLASGSLRSSDQLVTLLDELLDITRIRAGKLTLNKEPVDLTAVTRDCVASFSEEARLKRTSISFDGNSNNSVVGNWDVARVNQIVSNLISNALKYGDGKPIAITIESDTKANRARLMVRDYGIGIAPEMQPRIFERFERAISSNNISGLGLGLYIVRQIVEAHGGSIRVESELGRGSVFTVELPLEERTTH